MQKSRLIREINPNSHLKSIIFFLGVFLILSCSKSRPEITVIAQVDGAVITPFMLEREVFFGVNRENKPEQILQWKLNEHLIASELRRRGYEQRLDFKDAQKAFLKGSLVEEHFHQTVSSNVVATDQEIREEIQKRYVKFAFRFMPFESQEKALQYREIWKEEGYESSLKMYATQAELTMLSNRWQSPLIEAYDIDSALLSLIQNLSINEPSQPVLYQKQWVVFEVTDIRRQPIGELDYEQEWESAKKVVWNRKAMQAAESYVSSTMQPLDVRTDRKSLKALSDWLFPLFKDASPVRSIEYLVQTKDTVISDEAISAYKKIKNEVLVRWKGGTLTIADFLHTFVPGLYPIRAHSKESFSAQLSDAVALVVRDLVFLEKTPKKELLTDSLKAETHLREDKWLFQTYKNELQKQLVSDSSAVQKYYQRASQELNQTLIPLEQLNKAKKTQLLRKITAEKLLVMADSLRRVHPPSINTKIVDAEVNRINEKLKSQGFKNVQIFKNYANQPAWPSIDPIWALVPDTIPSIR